MEKNNPDFCVGKNLLRLNTVPSTNDVIIEMARKGAESGTVVVADAQTEGRGRFGRSFLSLPNKGLYMSVLLRPDEEMPGDAPITGFICVALCGVLEEMIPAGLMKLEIKWVNDVLWKGKKLAGILVQKVDDFIVVGIGVNLRQTEEDFGPELAKIATSIEQNINLVPLRLPLAKTLSLELTEMWKGYPENREEYLEEYRKRCSTIGKHIAYEMPEGAKQGKVLGINNDFSLKIEDESGEIDNAYSGEIRILA